MRSSFFRPKTVFLLFALLLTASALHAQPDPGVAPRKYTVAIDLVQLIDEGKIGNIFFKFHKFTGENKVGAFRVGLKLANRFVIEDRNDSNLKVGDPNSFYIQPVIGYEWQLSPPHLPLYGGIDLTGLYNESDDINDRQTRYTARTTAFLGFNQKIYRNISCSFEVGLSLSWNRIFWDHYWAGNAKSKDTYFFATTHFPYLFTLNYQF